MPWSTTSRFLAIQKLEVLSVKAFPDGRLISRLLAKISLGHINSIALVQDHLGFYRAELLIPSFIVVGSMPFTGPLSS